MHPLEKILDHAFSAPALLEAALTHPSLGKGQNNQRLEFLGDAVLGVIMAELLYGMYPQESEGELARRHAALVCGDTIAQVAEGCGLGQFIRMASSEATLGGRENPSNLEDVCEALIGALYLDGGLAPAKAFVLKHWERLARAVDAPPKDAKTRLQEWAQGKGKPIPAYTLLAAEGPAHAPLFTVQVEVQGLPPVSAQARSKRAAEQQAAACLLEKLTCSP